MVNNSWTRLLVVLFLVATAFFIGEKVLALLRTFSNIILIFFLAWLIAFLLSPAADALERRRVPRGLAVLAVYVGLVLVLVLIGVMFTPMLINQEEELERQLPRYLVDIQSFLNWSQSQLAGWGIPVDLARFSDVRVIVEQVQQYGTEILENTMDVVTGVAGVVSNLVLILIISVYIMLEGRQVGRGVAFLLPPAWRGEWDLLRQSVNQSFGGFIRGQIALAIIYGMGVGLVMAVAGLDYAVVSTLITTILAVIPFFGPILGLMLPAAVALFQVPWYVALLIIGVLVIYQAVIYQVVSPKLMGESVGLSPLLVLAAMLIGVQVSGMWGALFGVPVAAVVYAMGQTLHRQLMELWGEQPDRPGPPPEARPPA